MSGLSNVNILLRLEGAILLVGAILAYAYLGGNGWVFIALLLVPDLSMAGYALNTRIGSWLYNIVHHYLLPTLTIAIGLGLMQPVLVQVGLIWLAHIGMDRTVGYGLKYPSAFKDTHMQKV
jgi:hypothetical protein